MTTTTTTAAQKKADLDARIAELQRQFNWTDKYARLTALAERRETARLAAALARS